MRLLHKFKDYLKDNPNEILSSFDEESGEMFNYKPVDIIKELTRDDNLLMGLPFQKK